MKLSELIEQAEKHLKENGDVEVVFDPSPFEDMRKIEHIVFNPITNQLEIWIE